VTGALAIEVAVLALVLATGCVVRGAPPPSAQPAEATGAEETTGEVLEGEAEPSTARGFDSRGSAVEGHATAGAFDETGASVGADHAADDDEASAAPADTPAQ